MMCLTDHEPNNLGIDLLSRLTVLGDRGSAVSISKVVDASFKNL